MSAIILTIILGFLLGGLSWYLIGSRLSLSADSSRNEVLNLLVYLGGFLFLSFPFVLFVIELL